MKNIGFVSLLVLLTAFSPVIQAQQSTFPLLQGGGPFQPTPQVEYFNSGALTAQDTTNACNTAGACANLILGPMDQTASIVLSGTWSGTVTFEAQSNNGQWTQINGPTFQQGAAVGTATANGGWTFDVAGKSAIRCRMSSFSSGTATCGLTSSQARSTIGTIPAPQSLATTATPTFAGVNQTTGNQYNGVTSTVYVAAAGFTQVSGTGAQNITGLSWAIPSVSSATNFGFHCAGSYSQATGATAVTFSLVNSATVTNAAASGIMETAATAVAFGTPATAITTAATTAIVTGTPGAAATVYAFFLDGHIENPASTANTFNIAVTHDTTAANVVTISGDSYCTLQY